MLQRRNRECDRVEHISASVADRALVQLGNVGRVIGLEPNGILWDTRLNNGVSPDGRLQLGQLRIACTRERREQPGLYMTELLYPLGNIRAIAE